MCVRIYISFVAKKYKQKISTSKFINTNLCFFPLDNKGRVLCFLTKKSAVRVVFKCKLHLKSSVRLIRNFFCSRLGEDSFCYPYFWKQVFFILALSNSAIVQ